MTTYLLKYYIFAHVYLGAAEEVSSNSLKLARHYSKQKNYARAFSHYLVHCKLRQDQLGKYIRIAHSAVG